MSSLRSLLKAPGFTVVAVLTLAIGLGANTAIFSAVYSILLKPLPFPASEQLVSVRAMVKRETWERRAFSAPDFREYRAQTSASFATLAGFDGSNYNLTGEGEVARVRVGLVSAEFFDVLGVRPALGRTFTTEEDSAPDKGPVVVLSDDFWRNRFASSREVLGRKIKLTDDEFTVVGVMPPGFRGLDESTQLWIPLSNIGGKTWDDRGNRFLDAVGRLKPGVTLEQARAELAAVGLKLAAQYPSTNTNYSADLAPLREEFFGDLRRPLLVLLGAVGLVLAITCVNVANLLLVRLATRRREIAVRISLGASRGALARLFLSESAMLTLAGGALGLLLASWSLAALKRFAPMDLPSFVQLELHGPAFAFALGVALLCALAIGALPAIFAARSDLNAALKDGGRVAVSGAGSARTRGVLVMAELALSLALLVASSLFVRSFIHVVSQPPGYRTDQLVSARLLLPHQRYDGDARRHFAAALLERAATLPGVSSVALASDTPLDVNVSAAYTTIEGSSLVPAENEARAYTHIVTSAFFGTTGMTLLHGETFAAAYAANSEPVAVVSQNFARRFWPEGGAVGRRFKLGKSTAAGPWIRIIGVVAESRYRSLATEGTRDPDVYLAFAQRPLINFSIVLHTAGDSRTVGTNMRQLVAAIDPIVPIFAVATIEERISRASASQRFSAQLMGMFALLALLLAAIGLYGIVSFSVGERTQEIGVRMALGARPADIGRLVMTSTSRIVGGGLLAGLLLALAFSRLVEPLLFKTDPRDPLLYVGVGLLLGGVAALAAWLPARRAARVDPMTALRAE